MTNVELDPRIVRTRELVLAATAELLVEQGFERVTIEAIAERTGIARSTIYRNWPSRAELFVEAFDRICTFTEVPDLGSIREELTMLAAELVDGLTNAEWGSVLPSMIGVVAYDEELATAFRAFGERRRAIVGDVFRRAADRGEIIGPFTPEALAETFASGFFYHHLMARLPLDEAYIAHQINLVLTLARTD